jgi:SAM-dependent methyltransferase
MKTPSIFDWIEQQLHPSVCTSVEFIYDDMDSQSGRVLPVIYQPFDADNRSHWGDRGSCLDYLFSTRGGRLLDFGPGDGWPSLIVAPLVDEVVGVEGSHLRVDVCTENAKRLGVLNTEFVYVPPGDALPFQDDSFDGIMAATSIEQTPDPEATLRELFRVLRTGGRMRVKYEALNVYRGGRERDVGLWQIDDRNCRLMLDDRDIDLERVTQYGLTFTLNKQEFMERFSIDGDALSFEMITASLLEQMRSDIVDARICRLRHPSGETLASWLNETGFSEVLPTHSGAEFAVKLFAQLPGELCPHSMGGVDDMLRRAVEIIVQMPAPLSIDPMITAVK